MTKKTKQQKKEAKFAKMGDKQTDPFFGGMPENAIAWQQVKDAEGNTFRVPVPFLCHLDKTHGEAKYGWDGKWWCSECYIAAQQPPSQPPAP